MSTTNTRSARRKAHTPKFRENIILRSSAAYGEYFIDAIAELVYGNRDAAPIGFAEQINLQRQQAGFVRKGS